MQYFSTFLDANQNSLEVKTSLDPFYASIFCNKMLVSLGIHLLLWLWPEFPSLADISPDHPLLTQPHWNETFSVGRFTALCVRRVAKSRLANKPRKSFSSVNSVFDRPSAAVRNSRRKDGYCHS